MTLFIQRNDNDHVPCLLDLITKFLPLFSLSLYSAVSYTQTHAYALFFVGEFLFFYLGSIESAKPKAKHFILEIQDFLK